MDFQNRGHKWMAWTDDGGGAIIYPRWSAGAVTFPDPVLGYGITGVEDDSDFFGTSKDAIIYSIMAAGGTGGTSRLVMQDGDGLNVLAEFIAGSTSGANFPFSFGPQGIRIPGGFSIVPVSFTESWEIVYDIV